MEIVCLCIEVLADDSRYVERLSGNLSNPSVEEQIGNAHYEKKDSGYSNVHGVVVQCGRCYTVDSACNHLNNRGGGYECGVYVCESKDMDEKKHLLKPEIFHLTVEQFEELGETVMSCVSARMRSLRTNGDGACGMHALFGTPVFAPASNAYEL